MLTNARDVDTYGFLEITTMSLEYAQNAKVLTGIDLGKKKDNDSHKLNNFAKTYLFFLS